MIFKKDSVEEQDNAVENKKRLWKWRQLRLLQSSAT